MLLLTCTLISYKEFISKNKHLPDIPDANTIKKDGLNVEKMDAALLLKIEELTLYTINQQEQIELLIKRIEELEKQKESN